MDQHNHSHTHDYILNDSKVSQNERRTIFVVLLTFVTMIVEISYGYITGSMALLADGWHMASHVGALSISVIAYRLARSKKLNKHFSFGTGKFIPLGGYTSAILLGLVAALMGYESIERFLNPVQINFNAAIGVSVIGFVVNILSAILLWGSHDHHHHDDHHHHHHHHHDINLNQDHVHDHNHKSALIHVIADALTSLFAIVALFLGKYFSWHWADPIMGVVGAIVIIKWAYGLCKATVWELLDGNSKLISNTQVIELFSDEEEVEVSDLHIWRIAPNAHACELLIYSKSLKGSEFYRNRILDKFPIEHLIVEERLCKH